MTVLPHAYVRLPVAALPSKRTRPPHSQALVPAVPNTWTPEAQAAWEARWKDLGAMFLQERTEGLTEW
jgi:hypothetical protein